ncbi:hypothetical protein [Brassicibacter mesophilus]
MSKVDVRSLNRQEYKSYYQMKRVVTNRYKPVKGVNDVFSMMNI